MRAASCRQVTVRIWVVGSCGLFSRFLDSAFRKVRRLGRGRVWLPALA